MRGEKAKPCAVVETWTSCTHSLYCKEMRHTPFFGFMDPHRSPPRSRDICIQKRDRLSLLNHFIRTEVINGNVKTFVVEDVSWGNKGNKDLSAPRSPQKQQASINQKMSVHSTSPRTL